MWYRNIKIADQGVYIPYGPGGVNLLDMLYNFCNQSVEILASGEKTIDLVKLNSLIKNSYLANFISKVVLEPDGTGYYGTYNRPSKTMTINNNYTKRDYTIFNKKVTLVPAYKHNKFISIVFEDENTPIRIIDYIPDKLYITEINRNNDITVTVNPNDVNKENLPNNVLPLIYSIKINNLY